jgi:thiosulfate dehydrogenase (quinone) large subunit
VLNDPRVRNGVMAAVAVAIVWLACFVLNVPAVVDWLVILGGWLVLVYMLVRNYHGYAPAVISASGDDVPVRSWPFFEYLFQSRLASWFWLVWRVFIGWEWLEAGWHKFNDPAWMSTPFPGIVGFWTRSVAVPATGRPPITYDPWRELIQLLIDTHAETWLSYLIVFGEIAIGLGLILGALTGIAAFFGSTLNLFFLLSGTVSTNPFMLLVAFFMVLAWKNAGYIGLDYWLLPRLGVPWDRSQYAADRAPLRR